MILYLPGYGVNPPAFDRRDRAALNVAEDPDGVPEAVEWKAAGYGYFNPLVDFVPGETLTRLITEAGSLNPADAGAAAAQRYGLGRRMAWYELPEERVR